ncbi:MAG: EamA family transporter [Oceanisphaera sp.]|nr:EamA family transporter [Oceanisphaera sp.]
MFKGYLFIIAAAGSWGVIGIFSNIAFSQGVAPMEVAFWRAFFAWICFGGQALWLRKVRVRRSDLPMLALFGFAGVFLFYGSYQIAVKQGGAALASVLLYTAPAWVTLMAAIFFKERMSAPKWVALGLTLAGVVLVAQGSGAAVLGDRHLSLVGIGCGLLAGFCYALYYIFGKVFADRYAAETVFLVILPLGGVCLTPWVSLGPKTPAAWAALLALSFFCTYGAYHFYYAGLKHLEAGRAAITATLEPVVAAVVAYFWWGEFFTPQGYVGAAMILIAVAVMIRDNLRQPAAGPDTPACPE